MLYSREGVQQMLLSASDSDALAPWGGLRVVQLRSLLVKSILQWAHREWNIWVVGKGEPGSQWKGICLQKDNPALGRLLLRIHLLHIAALGAS